MNKMELLGAFKILIIVEFCKDLLVLKYGAKQVEVESDDDEGDPVHVDIVILKSIKLEAVLLVVLFIILENAF